MKLTFVGCGDAFGSGGRFHTCFHLEAAHTQLLIDCGASALIRLKALDIDRNAIDTILITHFHGDHFGGLPYFILDAQFSKRQRPLTIIGPDGLQDWFVRVMETTFPGSSGVKQRFDINLVTLQPDLRTDFEGFGVMAALVRHGHDDASFFAYRLEIEGKIISYTGDTEWTGALIRIAKNSDLLIAEAYYHDKKVPLHLDYQTLARFAPEMNSKRIILTHMSNDMLEKQHLVEYETAHDGKVITL